MAEFNEGNFITGLLSYLGDDIAAYHKTKDIDECHGDLILLMSNNIVFRDYVLGIYKDIKKTFFPVEEKQVKGPETLHKAMLFNGDPSMFFNGDPGKIGYPPQQTTYQGQTYKPQVSDFECAQEIYPPF